MPPKGENMAARKKDTAVQDVTVQDVAEDVMEAKEAVQEESPVQDNEPVSDENEETTVQEDTTEADEAAQQSIAPKRTRRKKKPEDGLSEAEKMEMRVARRIHGAEKASKEKIKEIYSHDRIFVEDGDKTIPETDATQRKAEWMELVASSKDHRILTGTIISIAEVETKMDKDDPDYIPEYKAKIQFKTGQFNVSIPSFALYQYEYDKMSQAAALDIYNNMTHRLGAEINFVVKYANEATGDVIGDRLMALSMRGVKYFTPQYDRPADIIPGMIVQAKITAMTRNSVVVDAAGAEIRIPLEELSWLYQSDARDFDGIRTKECYRVGKNVNVKILTAEPVKVRVRQQNYTLIKATGSIKQTQANPRLKYYDEFNVGDVYAGTITGITETGVYVNLANRMDCLCKFPKTGHRIPIIGENTAVKITTKDDEQRFIYGKLLS